MTDELGDLEQEPTEQERLTDREELQRIKAVLLKRTAMHVVDRAGIQRLEKRLGVNALTGTVQPVPHQELRLDDNEYRNAREAELAAQREKLLNATRKEPARETKNT